MNEGDLNIVYLVGTSKIWYAHTFEHVLVIIKNKDHDVFLSNLLLTIILTPITLS